ncbi:U1 [Hyposoter didymator ichnovirus]|nr:U1 [Hyposoter didymator ichnovirus]
MARHNQFYHQRLQLNTKDISKLQSTQIHVTYDTQVTYVCYRKCAVTMYFTAPRTATVIADCYRKTSFITQVDVTMQLRHIRSAKPDISVAKSVVTVPSPVLNILYGKL